MKGGPAPSWLRRRERTRGEGELASKTRMNQRWEGEGAGFEGANEQEVRGGMEAGFEGANEQDVREGPVQFEKDQCGGDAFGSDRFLVPPSSPHLIRLPSFLTAFGGRSMWARLTNPPTSLSYSMVQCFPPRLPVWFSPFLTFPPHSLTPPTPRLLSAFL